MKMMRDNYELQTFSNSELNENPVCVIFEHTVEYRKYIVATLWRQFDEAEI